MRERAGLITTLGAAALIVTAAAVCVSLVGFSPGYDAFGWLVWGHQIVYGSLNTGAAPSWKPLGFLFATPYALAGSHQPWLWMVTATAAAFAAPVFAGRIAWVLCGRNPGRRHAQVIAAVFAAYGVFALGGYWHLIMIASSDPMVVALCLAAIDFHLHGRHRIAFAMIVLASLGRPEAWPFALIYAAWAWRAAPSMRVFLIVGVLAIPAAWFAIPALTSKSPFIAGDLALGYRHAIHGHKLSGTVSRFLHNEPWPIHVLWLAAVALAAIRRDRTELTLVGAAVLWVAIEVGFALHGWPAVPRYLLESAAVLTVLAGATVGRAFAMSSAAPLPLRLAVALAAGVVVVALLPSVRGRLREDRRLVLVAQQTTAAIDRLHAIIVVDRGSRGILACGEPVTFLGDQSTLAWQMGLNVGQVGYHPARAVRWRRPIVLFERHRTSWSVLPMHIPVADRRSCGHLIRLMASTA